jgi:hypothetical protein
MAILDFWFWLRYHAAIPDEQAVNEAFRLVMQLAKIPAPLQNSVR